MPNTYNLFDILLSFGWFLAGVGMIFYGIRRITGKFIFSGTELIHLLFVRSFKGENKYISEKKRLSSKWRWNKLVAMESFLSSLILFSFSVFFFLIGTA